MKSSFLMAILLLVPVGLCIALAYMVGHAAWSIYSDWRLGQEVQQLRADTATRRERKRAESAQRLDNGCRHAFGGGLGGYPPNACPKCGLEQERPPGDCDHVWKQSSDAIPSSCCEKCGKKHQPLTSA